MPIYDYSSGPRRAGHHRRSDPPTLLWLILGLLLILAFIALAKLGLAPPP
jgi:hypothetical protein